jgi:hypothetical protein
VEQREALEEIQSPAELQSAARANQTELRRVQERIGSAFEQRDLQAMRTHTVRLSFLHTLEEEIYKRMPVS